MKYASINGLFGQTKCKESLWAYGQKVKVTCKDKNIWLVLITTATYKARQQRNIFQETQDK